MSDIPTKKKVMHIPRQVDIAVTGRCNLACQYCFYADEMTARRDLPKETWLTFFEELGRLGVLTVCLTGGEAFTRPDLFELIDGVVANRMRYSLLTNGTLITEETLEQFAIGKRRQRLDFIQISIDGSNAEVHDRSRPKSFGRALTGLKLLHEAGFPVNVRVTINRYNVNDLENIARLLLEEVGLSGIGTNEAFPCGATDRSGEITLTFDQRHQAMQILATLGERYPGRINATAGPFVYVHELRRIDKAIAKGETGFPDRGHLSSCGGAFNKIAVMHDGTLIPCHNLSTLHIGKIGQEDLGVVWRTHPILQALRARYTIPLHTLETCRECEYQGFCSGGCPGGALYLVGDLNARNPQDCYRVLKGKDLKFEYDLVQKILMINEKSEL